MWSASLHSSRSGEWNIATISTVDSLVSRLDQDDSVDRLSLFALSSKIMNPRKKRDVPNVPKSRLFQAPQDQNGLVPRFQAQRGSEPRRPRLAWKSPPRTRFADQQRRGTAHYLLWTHRQRIIMNAKSGLYDPIVGLIRICKEPLEQITCSANLGPRQGKLF